MKFDENVGAAAFWKCYQEICKLHWMTSNWTQRIRHEKHSTYAAHSIVRPKFSSVSLYNQPFQDIAHFMIFPLTPKLKFRSATKCLNMIAKKPNGPKLAISEIQHVQGRQKLEMHRITPNWTWTFNSPKWGPDCPVLASVIQFYVVIDILSNRSSKPLGF